MKRLLCALLCCALLCGILAGCVGNDSQEDTRPPSDPVSTGPESGLPRESDTLPAAPAMAFRQDAQFLPLEQAQREARFAGWLPAGNPLPSMENRVAYNEQMEYVIVVFSTQNQDETIYVTQYPSETNQGGVKPEPSQWNNEVERYAVGFALSLSVASKTVHIYTTGEETANMMAAAGWIAGL